MNYNNLIAKNLSKWSRQMTEVLGLEELIKYINPNYIKTPDLSTFSSDFKPAEYDSCFVSTQSIELNSHSMPESELVDYLIYSNHLKQSQQQQNFLFNDYFYTQMYQHDLAVTDSSASQSAIAIKSSSLNQLTARESDNKLHTGEDREEESESTSLNEFLICLIAQLLSERILCDKKTPSTVLNRPTNISQLSTTNNKHVESVKLKVIEKTLSEKLFYSYSDSTESQEPIASQSNVVNYTNDSNNNSNLNNNNNMLKQRRNKRGQYRRYESDQLNKAVGAVLNGTMSVHKAGSCFGVPHSTLEYKVKERTVFHEKTINNYDINSAMHSSYYPSLVKNYDYCTLKS